MSRDEVIAALRKLPARDLQAVIDSATDVLRQGKADQLPANRGELQVLKVAGTLDSTEPYADRIDEILYGEESQ
jgi:hypothetical protein